MYCDRCGKRIRSADATTVANGDSVCLECLQEYTECEDCGELFLTDEMHETTDGKLICDDCSDDYYVCDDCGYYVDGDDAVQVNNGDRFVCNDCLHNGNYRECECCQEWYSYDELYDTYDDNYVCRSCRDEYYYYCDECGYYVHSDEAYYNEHDGNNYCPNCRDSHEGPILSYHDFDASEFCILKTPADDYAQTITFGFELEVSGDRDYAEEFLKFFDDEVILMNDSSIKDGGFEIITMPMTKNYFYEQFLEKWTRALKFLTEKGFNGHNYGGLHIHLSPPSIPICAQLSRLMYNNNYKEMEVWKQLTQRREDDLHWCRFDKEPRPFDEILQDKRPRELYVIEEENGYRNYDRYVALNWDNRTGTYEFRIFNSNLRIERFLKNFEIVLSLLDYCKKYERATIPFVSVSSYLDFVEQNKLFYQNLYAFIEEKHIQKPSSIHTETRMVANGEPVVYEVPDIQYGDIEIPY